MDWCAYEEAAWLVVEIFTSADCSSAFHKALRDTDGIIVGLIDWIGTNWGFSLGKTVGMRDGLTVITVGTRVGTTVLGLMMGTIVSTMVTDGATDGVSLGTVDGAMLKTSLGVILGLLLSAVGLLLGGADGSGFGTAAHCAAV